MTAASKLRSTREPSRHEQGNSVTQNGLRHCVNYNNRDGEHGDGDDVSKYVKRMESKELIKERPTRTLKVEDTKVLRS